jgi:hypothetical protein
VDPNGKMVPASWEDKSCAGDEACFCSANKQRPQADVRLDSVGTGAACSLRNITIERST